MREEDKAKVLSPVATLIKPRTRLLLYSFDVNMYLLQMKLIVSIYSHLELTLKASLMRSNPRWDVRVPIMRASHCSFARSLSNLLLLLPLLAIAAQVRARPLLAERLMMTTEDYGRSLRPLPLRHTASPPPSPQPDTPPTPGGVEASSKSPPPAPKVAPPIHPFSCLNSPPSDDDLIISMVTDFDFEAPSKSPPPPPKVSPPPKQVKDDLEAPSSQAPPSPQPDTPPLPPTDDVEAPSKSPPPPPKVAPPIHPFSCLNSPPSDDDLIISMASDFDFEAPSKSPPPPPKFSPPSKHVKDDLEAPSSPPPPAPTVAPPQKPTPQKPSRTEDFEAPSRSPPPAPKVAPPRKPGINDFEAPSKSPPPPPKVSPPTHNINNYERTYKSPSPSQNSSPSTHQLTKEFGGLIMIISERSPPSAESYYSAY